MKPVEIAFAIPETILPGAQFGDAYQLTVDGLNLDPLEAARRAVYGAPSWINLLLRIRTLLVKPFGLKPGANPAREKATVDNIGIFPIIERKPERLVLGMNDRHLDFRLLVDIAELGGGRQSVTASTVVKTHNALGKIYLAIVKPFHRIIVPAMLSKVVRAQR
ncbi:MAG: DUF2867 domain-containing protein [Rhizobiaceae bacterium]